MGKPGTSSYEVEKKRLAAETEAARLRVLAEKTPIAEQAHRDALARETDLRRRWFG